MCLQYVCHFCGQDLEGGQSLVLCFRFQLTLLLTSGNHENCPDYVRAEASASSRCNLCFEDDPTAAESLLGAMKSMSGQTE